jgi:hypothetical protein
MAPKTTVDIGKIKDVTLGEIYKKKYPKLIVPMMGLTGPLWEVINKAGAKIPGKK